MSETGGPNEVTVVPVEKQAHFPNPASRDRVMREHRNARWLEAMALPLLTVALILFFTFLPATSDTFPTMGNLRVSVLSQSVLVIVAMASLLPIIAGGYDFSVGAVVGLSSIIVASLSSTGTPLLIAILAGAAAGLLIGAVNGFFVTKIHVDSVVVTLGMTIIVAGIVTWATSGKAIVKDIPEALTSLSKTWVFGLPGAFFVALVFTITTWYVLRQTPYGRYLEAVGVNRSAARLVGLRPDRITFIAFILSGVIAALAGFVQVGVAGAANPNVGENFTLPAIAAVFLSVAAITPGRFNVWGTIVAIIFLAVLNSGLSLAGASSYVNDFANGAALILGVSTASLLGLRRSRA
jgi:ribose transport system permease protein